MTARHYLAEGPDGHLVADHYGDAIIWPTKDAASAYGTPVGAVLADHPLTGYRRGRPTAEVAARRHHPDRGAS